MNHDWCRTKLNIFSLFRFRFVFFSFFSRRNAVFTIGYRLALYAMLSSLVGFMIYVAIVLLDKKYQEPQIHHRITRNQEKNLVSFKAKGLIY